MASRRSITTSPKPLTDKPDQKQTSRKDRQAGTIFPTLPDRTDCFCGSVSRVRIQNRNVFVGWYQELGSRIGIHITLYKPPSLVMSHSLHTSKLTGTHQEQLLDHLRVLLFFIKLNMLLFIMISRHRRQQNPAHAQPVSPPPPPPRRRRKPQNPWVMPWILQREERGCYRTLLDKLITTDIPGYTDFTRMEPAFFDLIKQRISPTPPPPSQEVNH